MFTTYYNFGLKFFQNNQNHVMVKQSILLAEFKITQFQFMVTYREIKIVEVHSWFGLSLLADETVVIASDEQLSIGVINLVMKNKTRKVKNVLRRKVRSLDPNIPLYLIFMLVNKYNLMKNSLKLRRLSTNCLIMTMISISTLISILVLKAQLAYA